jgi:hypothetical protein
VIITTGELPVCIQVDEVGEVVDRREYQPVSPPATLPPALQAAVIQILRHPSRSLLEIHIDHLVAPRKAA